MSGPRRLFHVFSTFALGGPQARFAMIANALGGRYQHSILAMDGNYDAADRLQEGVEYRLAREVSPRKNRTIRNVLEFRKQLGRMRPDLVLTYNWGSLEWALANTPQVARHVHVEDGFGPDEAVKRIARRNWLRRLALRRKRVVVASRTLERIAREEWRVPKGRLLYIQNGVEAARFSCAPDRELIAQIRSGADAPIIGTVAALRREKNLSLLVEAFAEISTMRPARLVVVGDGPERAAVMARAGALGVANAVTLTGRINDPAAILGGFDLFMMSSTTEQAPVSLMEAMAAECAVVATDVGDVADIVSQENKAFIVACDAHSLAAAASALLDDAPLRARIGAANREKCVREFDAEAMIESWRSVWEGGA